MDTTLLSNHSISLTDAGALLGMIFGTAGLTLGVLNHVRDNSNIKIRLSWDYQDLSPGTPNNNKLYGVVTVTNLGRRPVFISLVDIPLPKEIGAKHLLLLESIQG